MFLRALSAWIAIMNDNRPHIHPVLQKYWKASDTVVHAAYVQILRHGGASNPAPEPRACWVCPSKASLTHSWAYDQAEQTVMARVTCQHCSPAEAPITWVVVDGSTPVKRPQGSA